MFKKIKIRYMLEVLIFLAALIGSSIAAVYDLKTTEIPDQIPYAMTVIAIVFVFVEAFLQKSFMPILVSFVSGIVLLILGFLMYYLGQWGGGDAKLLAAIGFMSPGLSLIAKNIQFPFALSYYLNLMFIGYTVYTLAYVAFLSILNKKVFHQFFLSIKSAANTILIFSSVLFLVFVFLNWFVFHSLGLSIDLQLMLVNSLFFLFLSLFLFFLWKFLKVGNEVLFKKRIPVSKLKVGDMLLENKLYEGLTAREVRKIKKSGKKYVWIKSGICFAPMFPLVLLFTCFLGDAFLFYIKLWLI